MYRLKRGFTLIELLVVIAIIGILASIVLVALNSSRSSGRDSSRESELRQIQYALELYYDTNGQYPVCLYTCAGHTSLQGSTMMPNPPKDPKTGTNFNYASTAATSGGATCNGYHLGASLESPANATPLLSDADAAVSTTLCSGSSADFSGLSAAAGGAACVATPVGTKQPSGTESCFDLTNNS